MTNIMLLINAFIRDLDAASVGDSHKSLAQACRRRYDRLREDVLATCPQFRHRNGNDGDDIYDITAVSRLIQE